MKYFIGIDSGTSAIKAVLFDEKGNQCDKASRKLEGIFPTEICYEEDMGQIVSSMKLILKEVIDKNKEKDIVGFGITAQGDGLWMIDADGQPVRNGCCFCDGRAQEQVAEWNRNGVAEEVFKISGNNIFTGNQNSILKWMEKNEPQSLDKAKYFLHLKDYLFYVLTGKISTDFTDQSLVFIDFNNYQYSDELFNICGLSKWRNKFPEVLSAEENAAPLLTKIADDLGVKKDILVTNGPMDVSACALGSGVIESGHCCSIIGTAGIHEMVLDNPAPTLPRVGNTMTHVMKGKFLRLLGSLAGTPTIEWMLKTFGQEISAKAKEAGINVYEFLRTMAGESSIGANGVLYQPFIMPGGERAPFMNPYARGSYTGLSIRQNLNDIVRATYEGVAYSMYSCYEVMPETPRRITLCGGGANDELWCHIFADVMGVPIVTVEGEELGAKGAFINNAVIQKFYSSYEDAVSRVIKRNKIYEPNMENHKKYRKYYTLYHETLEALRETWDLRESLVNG